jgi:hypothetical protein
MTISSVEAAAWDVIDKYAGKSNALIRKLQDALDEYKRDHKPVISVSYVKQQLIDSRVGDVLYALSVANMMHKANQTKASDVVEMEAE